jgi:hypothetical protein
MNADPQPRIEEDGPRVPGPESLSPASLSPKSLSPASLSPASLSPKSLSPKSLSPESLSPKSLNPESLSPKSPAHNSFGWTILRNKPFVFIGIEPEIGDQEAENKPLNPKRDRGGRMTHAHTRTRTSHRPLSPPSIDHSITPPTPGYRLSAISYWLLAVSPTHPRYEPEARGWKLAARSWKLFLENRQRNCAAN